MGLHVKRRILRRMGVWCMALLLLFLPACQKAQESADGDIVTQKKTEEGRTQIGVLVKHAFAINTFEQIVEEKFPEIDIVQVGNYARDMGIAEYETRLQNHDIPDIVMTWPLSAGKEYWEENLIDLSGMDFTSQYNLSMLNDIATGGKLYYLPGPAQIRGIVYNKTLFQERGWEVPADFEGFISLCKTIEASGIRSLQLGFANEEVLDTAFIGYNYADYFRKPQDVQWIDGYNQGEGSFGDHFDGALDIFQRMIDEGIWKASDLKVDYAKREEMIFNRQCAMTEDSVLLARLGDDRNGSRDEFALMPFFNPGENSQWARLYMVCYIGLNKDLEKLENKKKYDMVMKLMEYISTPEGQTALAADTEAMYSSLIGMELPQVEEIKDLVPSLNEGRYGIFATLQNGQGALRDGLAGMLNGTMTKEEVLSLIDRQNRQARTQTPQEVIGTATERFTLTETAQFLTDAMQKESGCDIALFLDNGKDGKCNSKGLTGKIYEGDITAEDIHRIMPDTRFNETSTLWKVTMKGEDLIRTLESSIPVDNHITGWFYYFSGLIMTYDPTEETGRRIKKITTTDGQQIDPQKEYSIAVMDDSVPEKFLQSCEKTDIKIETIFVDAIQEIGSIRPNEDGRFQFETE